MKLKRYVCFGIIILFLVSTFFLSSCDNNKKVQEIKWAFWTDLNGKDKTAQVYKKVIDRYNEDYKDKYHCEIITSSKNTYTKKINTLIAANQSPDIFICSSGLDLTEYVDNGIATELTDLVKTEEKDWGNSFIQGIFDRVSYDGNIMAIPVDFAAGVVFYNTELFKKANVIEPRTYNELINVCEKLKQASITPIVVSASNTSTTNCSLGMLAAYLCDREGGPANLDGIKQGTGSWLEPSFVSGTTKLLQLSKYFQYTAKTDKESQVNKKFIDGQAAMFLQTSMLIEQMKKSCGVFKFPAIDGSKQDSNRLMVKTDNMVMSSKTKNKEACVALLKYFTDETAQKNIAEVGVKFPVINCEMDLDKTSYQYKAIKNIIDTKPNFTGFYDEAIENEDANDLFNKTMINIYNKKYSVNQGLNVLENYYKKNIWN